MSKVAAPRALQTIVLLVAVAFVSAAATSWWVERDPRPNAADVGFYDDMTTHHFQAITIANAYMRSGENRLLRHIAWEVAFSQAGDIRVMQAALSEWDEVGSPDVAMEWMDMRVPQDAQPGMASDQDLAALERARGSRLDDLYSTMMIDHHAGGVHMATAAAERAGIGDVRDLARLMAKAQQNEIGELNFAREKLGLARYEPEL